MFDFILQIITFASLGFIVYLFARALPRISENEQAAAGKPDYFDKMMKKLPLGKIDSAINLFLGKILRKMKVILMKVDNLMNYYINKLRTKQNGNGKDLVEKSDGENK